MGNKRSQTSHAARTRQNKTVQAGGEALTMIQKSETLDTDLREFMLPELDNHPMDMLLVHSRHGGGYFSIKHIDIYNMFVL